MELTNQKINSYFLSLMTSLLTHKKYILIKFKDKNY